MVVVYDIVVRPAHRATLAAADTGRIYWALLLAVHWVDRWQSITLAGTAA